MRTARCRPIFGVFPAGNGTACPGADCRVSVCGFWPYRSVRRKEATTDSSQGLREDFAANGPFRCGEPMLVAVFRFAASFPRQSAFRFFVVLLLRPGESLLKAGHAGRSSCGAGERIFSFSVPNDRGAGWAWAGEAIAARCRAGRRFRGRDVLSPDMGGAGKRRPFRAFGRGGIGNWSRGEIDDGESWGQGLFRGRLGLDGLQSSAGGLYRPFRAGGVSGRNPEKRVSCLVENGRLRAEDRR